MRTSAMDARYLREVCKKWFVEQEPSFTLWGPVTELAQKGLYSSDSILLKGMRDHKHILHQQ